MNILSLFDGISCAQISLNRSSIIYDNYFSSEIDKYAIKITNNNYPDTIQLGDIEKINISILPKIDIIIGGSPCQDLSILKIGDGLVGNKSRLLLKYVELVNILKPKYFLLENVIPRKKEWKLEIDYMLGCNGILINSDRFINQNRPRIYWTNIDIDYSKIPDRPNWNSSYYQFRRNYFRENKSGVCPCLTSNMGTGGHNVPLKSKNLKDKISPEECEYLQTIPIGYTKDISNSQRYKLIGNSMTVDVISNILNNIR